MPQYSAYYYDKEYFLIAPLFGALGAVAAIVFTVIGSAYGTAKCMIGIASIAPRKPQLILKSMVPMIMASVIGIYGLVVSVIIVNRISKPPDYTLYNGFVSLGAGVGVGLCGLAAGFAIGNVGDAGIKSAAQRQLMYTSVVLMTGFAMVAGMYGLVMALVQVAKI